MVALVEGEGDCTRAEEPDDDTVLVLDQLVEVGLAIAVMLWLDFVKVTVTSADVAPR